MVATTNKQMKSQLEYSSIAWKWLKKYFNMENTVENWHAAIEEAERIDKEHDSLLLRSLLLTYIDELERVVKKRG